MSVVSRRHTSQPTGAAAIDWSNPLTRDLVLATYAEESTMFRNMADGRLATENAGTPAFNAFILSQWGRAKVMRSGSFSNSFRLAGGNLSSFVRGKMTLLLVCVPKVSVTTGRFITSGGEQSGAWNMARIGTTAGDYFIGTQANGATLQSDAPFNMGELYVVGFTSFAQASPSLGRQRLYVNGVKQSTEGTYAGTNGKVIDNIGIGGSGQANQADMYAVFAWNRELSSGEMAEISANPYQLFTKRRSLLKLAASAPVDPPRLTVQAAQVLLASGDVTMRISRRVTVQAAQLQLAGADIGVRASRKIAAQLALLSASLGQVDLRAARRVTVAVAELALQPEAAQLRAVRRLAVAPSSAVFAGGMIEFMQTPVEGGNNYSLPVSPATLALTGGNVTMRISRRMPIGVAQLAMVVAPVRMIAARCELVSPAHLVLTGSGVTLRFSAESPPLDIAKVHPSRVVIFEGSGSKVVIFEGSGSKVVVFEGSGSKVVVFEGSGKRMRFNDMSAKVPVKVGEKWTTDRDRDEISYYAADITDELADRNTTAVADEVTAPVYGVELLEGPQVQVATVDGVGRTFVVVKLGDVDGDIPDDWRWVARVPCANGERFDKTTWFNEVDP